MNELELVIAVLGVVALIETGIIAFLDIRKRAAELDNKLLESRLDLERRYRDCVQRDLAAARKEVRKLAEVIERLNKEREEAILEAKEEGIAQERFEELRREDSAKLSDSVQAKIV